MALRAQAPGVRVAIRNLDLPQLEAQMARGEVDLALITPEAGPPSLRTRHLFDERYVLIGRRKHPRLKRNITIAEFARLEQVVVSLDGGGFATPVDNALATLGHKRNVVLSAASSRADRVRRYRSRICTASLRAAVATGRPELMIAAPMTSNRNTGGAVADAKQHASVASQIRDPRPEPVPRPEPRQPGRFVTR